jgi:hypothetical protein
MIKDLLLESLLSEAEGKTAYLVFSKFNPITKSHQKMVEYTANKADPSNLFIFPSKTEDFSKLPDGDIDIKLSKVTNPLDFNFKLDYMKKVFSSYSKSIVDTKKKNILTVMDALNYIYDIKIQGSPVYKNVVIVVGKEVSGEFLKSAQKYNDTESKHGFYVFDSISVDGFSRGTDSKSSDIRKLALLGNFDKFKSEMPSGLSSDDITILYNKLRVVYGIS